MQKQLCCAQFASLKHQKITRILEEVLTGKVPATLFTEEFIMKWFGLKDCFNSSSDNLKPFMDRLGECLLPIPYSYRWPGFLLILFQLGFTAYWTMVI